MSRDSNFLEPYLKAKDQFDVALKDLQNTVSDNPTQVKRLDEVASSESDAHATQIWVVLGLGAFISLGFALLECLHADLIGELDSADGRRQSQLG